MERVEESLELLPAAHDMQLRLQELECQLRSRAPTAALETPAKARTGEGASEADCQLVRPVSTLLCVCAASKGLFPLTARLSGFLVVLREMIGNVLVFAFYVGWLAGRWWGNGCFLPNRARCTIYLLHTLQSVNF